MDFALKDHEGVKYLIIPSFEDTGLVKHGFSTRVGGVSEGVLASLNLGIKKADAFETLMENYSRFCDALGIDVQNLVLADQVHGTAIHVAGPEDRGKGITRETDIFERDALITRHSSVALVTFFADCVPLFFLDTKTPAIGVAHAGWRGTVKEIGPKTVAKMISEYGSDPKDILVGIGPCIHSCCYEVDTPVATKFFEVFDYAQELLKPTRPGHWMLNLVLANRKQMEMSGILPKHIYQCHYCTSCNRDLFYSHRGDCGKTGSLAGILELKL